ncbi:hypothetical protein ACLBR5_26650 [Escherichia coli]
MTVDDDLGAGALGCVTPLSDVAVVCGELPEAAGVGDRSRCRTIKRTLVQGKKIISSLCQFRGVM